MFIGPGLKNVTAKNTLILTFLRLVTLGHPISDDVNTLNCFQTSLNLLYTLAVRFVFNLTIQ